MNTSLNRKALLIATLVSALVVAMVFYGSRNLQNFDPALIGYLFGTVFAFFGIVYRYSVWLQRPPTWMYFKRTWQFLFKGQIFAHLFFFVKEFIQNIGFQ